MATSDPFRFQAHRAILADMPTPDLKLEAFRDFASDVAQQFKVGRFDKVVGVDELANAATAYGLTDTYELTEIEAVIGEAFTKIEQAKTKLNGKHEKEMALATPYVAPDPLTIPARSWLHGGHYVRDAATATVAPGGYGKTTLTLYESLVMASGGLRVWYISGEDPKVEIDRRIAAHCQHHGMKISDFKGKLFVDDKATFPLSIAKSPRAASIMWDEHWLSEFENAIMVDAIDVVMLDPFVSFHQVPENDNGAIDGVIKRLAAIAYRRHCCIEISHHVRKSAPGQTAITVDDTRGGGAIVNAVRSSRVINRMSTAEAEKAKIDSDKRSSYIRLDRGKRNMAPADAANWFRIVSVLLANGDNVQSIEEWDFPKSRQIEAADTEWLRRTVAAKQYRTSSKSPEWLGIPIAERFECDLNVKGGTMFVNKAISTWLKAGVLIKVIDSDKARMKREFFALGEGQQPSESAGAPWDEEDNGD